MYGGFLVTDEGLRGVMKSAARGGDADRVFEYLEENAEIVKPEYTYPPFILALTLDYARRNVAGFRQVTPDAELADALGALELTVALQATPDEASSLHPALGAFRYDEGELHRYFVEAVEEEWESAPAAMREALTYLRTALLQASDRALNFVLLIS